MKKYLILSFFLPSFVLAQDWQLVSDYSSEGGILYPTVQNLTFTFSSVYNGNVFYYHEAINDYETRKYVRPFTYYVSLTWLKGIRSDSIFYYDEYPNQESYGFYHQPSGLQKWISRDSLLNIFEAPYTVLSILNKAVLFNKASEADKLFFSLSYPNSNMGENEPATWKDYAFIDSGEKVVIPFGGSTSGYINGVSVSYDMTTAVIDEQIYIAYESGMPFENNAPERAAVWNGNSWQKLGLNELPVQKPQFIFKYLDEIYVVGKSEPDVLGNPTNFVKLRDGLIWEQVGVDEIGEGLFSDFEIYRGKLYFEHSQDIGLFNFSSSIYEFDPVNGFRKIAGINDEFNGAEGNRLNRFFIHNDQVYVLGSFKIFSEDTIVNLAKFPLEKWNEMNQAPEAMNDEFSWFYGDTLVELNVLSNDQAIDGDYLKVEMLTEPNGGTYSFKHDGTIMYQPDFSTQIDSFTYNACDMLGLCDQASVIIRRDDTSIGITNHNQLKKMMYPNPASNKLFIKNQSIYKGSIRISNLLGELMFEKTYDFNEVIQIDVSSFIEGTYLVSFIDANEIIQKKIQIIR